MCLLFILVNFVCSGWEIGEPNDGSGLGYVQVGYIGMSGQLGQHREQHFTSPLESLSQ